ncbi:MAG: hypothetical protein QF752_08525, partial [Planctomycetota bacterium]|nr:hypothetical protein [Planctomycetota bacterium]
MPRLKIPAFLLLLICGISPAFTQSDRPKRQPGLWQKALLPIAPESPSPETRPQRAATALIAWTRILGETIKNPHWDAHSGPYIRSLQEDLSRLDLS